MFWMVKCWNVSEKAAPTNRTAITSMQVQIWYGDRTMADSGLLHWIQSMCGNVLHHSLYEAAMTMALALAMAMAMAKPLKINCHKIRHFSCQSSIYELCRILILWHLPTLSSYSQCWWKLMVICVNVLCRWAWAARHFFMSENLIIQAHLPSARWWSTLTMIFFLLHQFSFIFNHFEWHFFLFFCRNLFN